MVKTIVYGVLLSMLLCPQAAVQAQTADKVAIEKMAKEIEGELIAPCCWRSPLDKHHSGAAENMKAEIRQLLNEGQAREQIMGYYLDKYGEQILSAPTKEGFNLLAYLLPGFVMLLGAGVILLSLNKWRAMQAHRTATADEENRPAQTNRTEVPHQAQIEAELQELD